MRSQGNPPRQPSRDQRGAATPHQNDPRQAPHQKRPTVSQEGKEDGTEDGFDDDGDLGEDFNDIEGMDGFDLDGSFDEPTEMFGSDPAYNNAVQKAQFVHVKYVKHLTKHIDASTLFPDTKETLKMIVRGLFDATEVYAKTKNLALEEIETEIVLAQARFGFHPADVDNPSLSNILNMIRKLYRRFISRSENGWERELDNRFEQHTTSTQRIIDDRFARPATNPKSQYPIYSPKRWI